jgi:hypothetical protein
MAGGALITSPKLGVAVSFPHTCSPSSVERGLRPIASNAGSPCVFAMMLLSASTEPRPPRMRWSVRMRTVVKSCQLL